MKKEELFQTLNDIDERYIEEAKDGKARRKIVMKWKKAAVLAACLCFIVGVRFYSGHSNKVVDTKKEEASNESGSSVQTWTEDFKANDYFTYSEETFANKTSSSEEESLVPDKKIRDISKQRKALEKEGVLPEMEGYTDESFVVEDNKDGSLYDVVFSWYNDDKEDGKALQVVASEKEISDVQDSMQIARDKNGKILEPNVTVTKRDGVEIIASGIEDGEKTIIFHKDHTYYQITGSWSNDYESVVKLMEWFWEHPIDFSRFSSES